VTRPGPVPFYAAPMDEVKVDPCDTDRFRTVLGEQQWKQWEHSVAHSRELLGNRTIWNLNSTSRGGGVAEMLWSLVAYGRGLDLDVRWLVMDGDEPFFRVTKRIHNLLHGSPGDGLGLADGDRADYERVAQRNADELVERTAPGDIVLLHDPQTAGLVPLLPDDRIVVWRSHIGIDLADDRTELAWSFLRDYVDAAQRYVFTRREYAPPGLDPERLVIIPPSIDAFSPKNQELDAETVRAVLATAGLVGGAEATTAPEFVRTDGRTGTVVRRAELRGAPPPADAPLVVQVSRWDRLKDPVGVIRGFAGHVAAAVPEAHFMYAGPAAAAVADDPEGAEALAETVRAWEQLPEAVRARVHLANLPMDDAAENAVIVNALQRHATVVVQKSLAEGFGLTVAEAMWKSRPVVASGMGGILDQIEDGVSGVLLRDPCDLASYGGALVELLTDHERADRMGRAARERVQAQFLSSRHLMQYEALFTSLV
jgi:trehalose synthase